MNYISSMYSTDKKAFQSKANCLLFQGNMFEQVCGPGTRTGGWGDSQVNKFEHVHMWSQTDRTENITFLQLY